MEPLAPFNGTSPEMKAIGQALLDAGLFTFVRWNTIMTNPPLCITEAELDEGFEILDSALEIGDRAASEDERSRACSSRSCGPGCVRCRSRIRSGADACTM